MNGSYRTVAVLVITLGLLGLTGIVVMGHKPKARVVQRRPRTRSMAGNPDEEVVLTRKSRYFETPPSSPESTEEIEDKDVQIIPNSGGGDCLFHCFKTALLFYGVKTTIKALREVVADAATQDQFETLKVIYDNALDEKEYQVVNDYLFMNGVKDLEGFRKAMMKRSYWGDEMALRAMEKKTKFKVLVFTTITGKMELASQLDTKDVPESGKYMMVLLHNLHYQLIKYGNQVVLEFDELPPQIQEELGQN